MGITREQEVKRVLKAKGILVGIDDDGLHIEDEKEGKVETLSLDDFRIFEGKVMNISVTESVKSEIVEDSGIVSEDE